MKEDHHPSEISEIQEKIMRLKKEKDALIITHHYAPVETHAVSDVLSDSRGFFKAINDGIQEQVVVVVAPFFFAEIAACMLPDKTVLVPVQSECPVANHVNYGFDRISDFKEKHPGIPLLCYATSPLRTKLLADYIAFPGEVVETAENAPEATLLFAGERNCALDAASKTKKELILYPGNPVCNVYDAANSRDVQSVREQYPDALLFAHPECSKDVLDLADAVSGTGVMTELIENAKVPGTFILATEHGFYERMKNEFPQHTFVHLSPFLSCNVFKVLRLEKILETLENMTGEVRIDRLTSLRIGGLIKRLYEQETEVYS